ncbi:MAG: enoyl-ACP reductase FabI [Acidimicrobiia bacterium]
MGILEGKKILITGVLTDSSLAFGVAKIAQEQGAEIILTGAGRGLSITKRTAGKLPVLPEVLELDITNQEHIEGVRNALKEKWGTLDGALHAIGYAPPECLGDDFMSCEWPNVSTAIHISTYSLKALADVVVPLMPDGGSLVGLDFDATGSWPAYGWMGVAKAALESTSRYLARQLGPKNIRVNLVAAGPIKTIAAKSIPEFQQFEDGWNPQAPLGWDVFDIYPVAKSTVALLSDWFPSTTGEIIHVDGGFHSTNA